MCLKFGLQIATGGSRWFWQILNRNWILRVWLPIKGTFSGFSFTHVTTKTLAYSWVFCYFRKKILPRIETYQVNFFNNKEKFILWKQFLIQNVSQKFRIANIERRLNLKKNSTYGRQRISLPMRIDGPILFWDGCVIYLSYMICKKKYCYPPPL